MNDTPVEARDAVGITAPSIQSVATTFVAIDRTIVEVKASCREIADTLSLLGEALGTLTHSSTGSQAWGSFGLIGLPVIGALRAAKVAASNYVRQQTGVPLATWMDLVTDATSRFEEFIAGLDRVSALADRYGSGDGSTTAVEEEDVATLATVRWEATAWKAVLGRVAKVGQVVEAVLQADLGLRSATPDEPLEESGGGGFGGALQRRLKDVQSRTIDRSSDLRDWVLQPLLEIRDSVRDLPNRVETVSHDVALLEVLLELQEAEIRACLGQIPRDEARVVGARAAAEVLIPELARDLASSRSQVSNLEARMTRLTAAYDAAQVEGRAHDYLAGEYQGRLAGERARLADLEARAEAWRGNGSAVLDAATDWVRLQLDVLAARRAIGDQGETDREVPLRRELEQLAEARGLLATL